MAPPRNGLPAAIEGNTLEGLKILVVDDDYRNIFAMTAVLERGNAVVSVAESGAEAIAALEQTPDIDIVLMDIMMPVMDGYDTIRAIRKINRFEVLPIVAVTGKAAAGERERCLEAGADDYIPKPVDTGVLLAVPRSVAPDSPGTRTSHERARIGSRAGRRCAHAIAALGRPHPPGRRRRSEAVGAEGGAGAAGLPRRRGRLRAAALRCLMAEDFAVILLDVRMPIMDGFETAAPDPVAAAVGDDPDHLHHRS